MSWEFDPALAALWAALVAAGVSLLSLIISKENKTSDFRQAWVDALRSETTTLVSEFRLLAHHRTNDAEVRAALLKVRAGQTVIRLRLRPDEQTTPDVIAGLAAIDDLINRGDWEEKAVEKVTLQLEHAIQPVLKANWNRVRDGEPWFRATRWAAGLGIASALPLLLVQTLPPLISANGWASGSVDWLGISSAGLGAVGTALLFKGTFGLVPPQGFLSSAGLNTKIKAGNVRRQKLQRAGLCLLLVSFLIQAMEAAI